MPGKLAGPHQNEPGTEQADKQKRNQPWTNQGKTTRSKELGQLRPNPSQISTTELGLPLAGRQGALLAERQKVSGQGSQATGGGSAKCPSVLTWQVTGLRGGGRVGVRTRPPEGDNFQGQAQRI